LLSKAQLLALTGKGFEAFFMQTLSPHPQGLRHIKIGRIAEVTAV
jgi:hypothetical protein